MLIATPASLSRLIHSSLVNCDPWSVLKISGTPNFEIASSSASRQKSAVSVLESPKARTLRLAPAHGVIVPTHEAVALIAYLASLKQPPWAGSETAGGEPATASMTNAAPVPNPTAPTPGAAPAGYDAAKGAALYTANCSACHQGSGEGLPGAFPSLKGNEVVNDEDATQHIEVVLHGLHDAKVAGIVYATVMPPFAATLSDAAVADIIDYERSSWGNHGKPVISAQVATGRAKASSAP